LSEEIWKKSDLCCNNFILAGEALGDEKDEHHIIFVNDQY